jgi:hypothetical protein
MPQNRERTIDALARDNNIQYFLFANTLKILLWILKSVTKCGWSVTKCGWSVTKCGWSVTKYW